MACTLPIKAEIHIHTAMTSVSSSSDCSSLQVLPAHYEGASSSSSSPSPSPSPSPPLSRSSSYSTYTTTYPSSTFSCEDECEDEDEDGQPIIGILKKSPRQPRIDEDNDADEESDCDCESEVEVVFERNVTFNDPLATDIVTGAVVSPSPRTRREWTALKARESLERYRVFVGHAPGTGLEFGLALGLVENGRLTISEEEGQEETEIAEERDVEGEEIHEETEGEKEELGDSSTSCE
ncbi:hypothetical protein HD806DRAFT_3103 [Xylariaceae sp. AK1471]|nr:hypothetical protein HD806DRAFT_3103 [Xylariaceae sp. AK1471]